MKVRFGFYGGVLTVWEESADSGAIVPSLTKYSFSGHEHTRSSETANAHVSTPAEPWPVSISMLAGNSDLFQKAPGETSEDLIKHL